MGRDFFRNAGVQYTLLFFPRMTVSSNHVSSNASGSDKRNATNKLGCVAWDLIGHPPCWKNGTSAGTSSIVRPAWNSFCLTAFAISALPFSSIGAFTSIVLLSSCNRLHKSGVDQTFAASLKVFIHFLE